MFHLTQLLYRSKYEQKPITQNRIWCKLACLFSSLYISEWFRVLHQFSDHFRLLAQCDIIQPRAPCRVRTAERAMVNLTWSAVTRGPLDRRSGRIYHQLLYGKSIKIDPFAHGGLLYGRSIKIDPFASAELLYSTGCTITLRPELWSNVMVVP